MIFPVTQGKPIVWGIIGTGQSLSVGARSGGTPYSTLLSGAGANHYMLSNLVGSGGIAPTANPSSSWTLATLSEPVRGSGLGTSWPSNVLQQSLHAPLAYRISQSYPNMRTAHTIVGQDGQGIAGIKKGGSVASYAGSIAEVTKFKQLFDALGYSYRVAAVLLTHGEQDMGSTTYGTDILQLQSDYDTDVRAITGQSNVIPIIATQPSSGYPQPPVGLYNNIDNEILNTYVAYPNRVILAGSKLGLSYWSGDFHIDNQGSVDLGYLYSDFVLGVINGTPVSPLYPVSVSRSGTQVTVTLNRNVVLNPSLYGGTHGAGYYSGAWVNGKGFEAIDGGGTPVVISSVTILNNIVTINCATTPSFISHAYFGDATGSIRRTQISDASNNWLVQFQKPV